MARYPQQGDGVPVWVLLIEYRGRRLAWTSDGQEVSGLDALVVGAVEVPDISDRIDLDGQDVREPVAVSVPWFEGEQPRDIQSSPVELALVPLSTWGSRYVLLRGRVTRTELDRPGALIGVELSPADDAGDEWPPSTWVVDDKTFPETIVDPLAIFPAHVRPKLGGDVYQVSVGPDPASIGKGYPVPYGKMNGNRPNYKLPIVDRHANANNSDANELLAAGGVLPDFDFDLWVVVDDVIDESGLTSPAITPRIDGLGQALNTIQVTSAASKERKSKDWYITIHDNASPTATAGAGHVASWVLGRSQAVDLAWSGEAIARSTGLEIGGFIDEPVAPLAWVQDRVTGRLPLATSRAPGGLLRLAWVPYLGAPVAADLVDGERGVLRSGAVKEEGEQSTNRVEVRYALDAYRDEYTKSLVMLDGPADETTPTETIEADDVHTDTTAGTVGGYALWRKRYRRTVSLDVPVEGYGWLLPGMVVRYTDSDLGVSRERYLVLSIQRTDRPFTALELTPI